MDEAQFIEWVDQHQSINEAHFLQLIDQHHRIIGKICRLYGDTIEEREILYHQIVFQLWKSAPSFLEKAKFTSWIYRVALSTSIASTSDKRSNILNTTKYEQVSGDPKEHLFNTLKKLTDDDKAIFTLYLEGLTYPEIAEISGHTETIIGVKLNRIKKKIQQPFKNSIEQYSLRSMWQNINTESKSHAEVRVMLSAQANPIIIGIKKRLVVESILFVIFLFICYNFFGSNIKPLYLQVILATGILFIFLNKVYPYILSKRLAKGRDIKKSLEDNLIKLKSHVILSIISRLLVVGCVLLFGKLVFATEMVRYTILILVVLFFTLQSLFLLKLYNKRIRQMKNTIDHLKRQKEFTKNVD